jgi:hypothetical protein
MFLAVEAAAFAFQHVCLLIKANFVLLQHSLHFVTFMSTTTAAEKRRAYDKSSSAASSTSFYTTEEKKDHYSTLEEVLESKCYDPLVRQVIQDLMRVCAAITEALRVALVTVEGTTNEFGDSQLSVDVSVLRKEVLLDLLVQVSHC